MAETRQWMLDIQTAQADAKIDRFSGYVDEVSRSLLKAGKELDKATKELREMGTGADKAAREAKKLNAEVAKTGKATSGFKKLGDGLSDIRGKYFAVTAAVTGTVYTVTKFTSAIIQATDKAANLRTQLRVLEGTNKSLGFSLEELTAVANKSFADIGATQSLITRTGRALSASGVEVNKQQLSAFTTAINQAAIVSGAGAQESGSAIYQLTQALASGRFAGDELRSVLEGLPRLAEAIAKGLDVNVGKLREMGSAGKLGPLEVMNAILKRTGALNKEFGLVEVTSDKYAQTLSNNMTLVLEHIGKSTGLTELWRKSLKGAAGAAGELAKNLQAAAVYEAARVKAPEKESSFGLDFWNAVTTGDKAIDYGGAQEGTIPLDKAREAEVKLHTEMAKLVTEASKLPKEGTAALLTYTRLEKKFRELAAHRKSLGSLVGDEQLENFGGLRDSLVKLDIAQYKPKSDAEDIDHGKVTKDYLAESTKTFDTLTKKAAEFVKLTADPDLSAEQLQVRKTTFSETFDVWAKGVAEAIKGAKDPIVQAALIEATKVQFDQLEKTAGIDQDLVASGRAKAFAFDSKANDKANKERAKLIKEVHANVASQKALKERIDAWSVDNQAAWIDVDAATRQARRDKEAESDIASRLDLGLGDFLGGKEQQDTSGFTTPDDISLEGFTAAEMKEAIELSAELRKEIYGPLQEAFATPAEWLETQKQTFADQMKQLEGVITDSEMADLWERQNKRMAEVSREIWTDIGSTFANTLQGIGESTESTFRGIIKLL